MNEIAEKLNNLNNVAEELNIAAEDSNNLSNVAEEHNPNKTTIDIFKAKLFRDRVTDKINPQTILKAHNWQTLHALVSLMCRKDESAKRWLEILVAELDSIMIHLGNRGSHQSAYGTSHPDYS
jgi:hypothetical protein